VGKGGVRIHKNERERKQDSARREREKESPRYTHTRKEKEKEKTEERFFRVMDTINMLNDWQSLCLGRIGT